MATMKQVSEKYQKLLEHFLLDFGEMLGQLKKFDVFEIQNGPGAWVIAKIALAEPTEGYSLILPHFILRKVPENTKDLYGVCIDECMRKIKIHINGICSPQRTDHDCGERESVIFIIGQPHESAPYIKGNYCPKVYDGCLVRQKCFILYSVTNPQNNLLFIRRISIK